MSNVMQPTKHHRAYQLLGILLIMAAIGLVVYLGSQYWARYKSSDATQKKAASVSQAKDVVGDGKLQANEQRGQGTVTSDCYEFVVPRSVSLGNNTYCNLSLAFGSTEANQLTVSTQAFPLKEDMTYDFTAGANQLKQGSLVTGTTLSKEDKPKLGGQEGVEYILETNGQKQAVVLVPVKNTSIPGADGKTIQAVQISMPYNTKEQAEVLQGIIETWKWK